MSLKDLTQGDFSYFKSYADDMKACHEREFKCEINPDLMRAMYRGRTKYELYEKKSYGSSEYDNEDWKKHLTALSIIFQATNTILPQTYYQNPSPIVVGKKGSDDNSAALMSAVLKHYMKLNDAKRQNQEAVLNAWFFGIGYKKIGYRSVFQPRVNEPETQVQPDGLMGQMMNGIGRMLGMGPQQKPDNFESRERPELADYETLFNDSENPMNVMLDHKADLMNCKAYLHYLPRTLHDLELYGDYEPGVLKELFEHLKEKEGSRFDSRKTELHLNELQIMQRNGVWILTWVDEFAKPLRYEQSTYAGKGFLWTPLSLTYEPGVRYPISHLKVGSQVQTKLDDLASMWVELTARSANLIQINEKALALGQSGNLEKNLLRGIVRTKGPLAPGDLTSFNSGNVSSDYGTLVGLLQQKITEILGADSQMVSGNSKNDTLGQDELARVGTQLRNSGLKDRVRDWMIEQLRKEGTLIKQFSNTQLDILITGKDYADPQTGQTQEDRWASFMTPENPLGLKHYLQGEFDYDVNIEEAIQPDKKKQRIAYQEMIITASNPAVQQAALQSGVRFNMAKAFELWVNSYDGVVNSQALIEKLDPLQVAAAQASQVLMQNAGMAGGGGTPPKPSNTSDSGVSAPSASQPGSQA